MAINLLESPIHRHVLSLMALTLIVCLSISLIYFYQTKTTVEIEKMAYAYHLKTASASADALESLAMVEKLQLRGLQTHRSPVNGPFDTAESSDDISSYVYILDDKIKVILDLDVKHGESQFNDLINRLKILWRAWAQPPNDVGDRYQIRTPTDNAPLSYSNLRAVLRQIQLIQLAEYEAETEIAAARYQRVHRELLVFILVALVASIPIIRKIFRAIDVILSEKAEVERRLLEEQKEQANLIALLDSQLNEIKKLDRIKSEFVSTVSHELRTPMTSIRGALGLIVAKFSDGLDERVRTLLNTADRNSERLVLLINDILDFDKLQSGKMKMDFGAVDISALSRQAMEDNAGYALKNSVSMSLHTESGATLVRGDRSRLLQVFANLISNAIKFSLAQGRVEIHVLPRGDVVRVEVRDFGTGIPDEFKSRIFQRFSQADSSDTRQKGGTGLGLSITKAIVEQHGGRVGFVSEPGKGTTFQFDIPVWREGETHATPVAQPSARVLICEDDTEATTFLGDIMRQMAINYDIVYSIEKAKECLKTRRYQALLLDLSLPDGDGLQFVRELRSDSATSDLPIVVVTGHPRDEQIAAPTGGLHIIDWLQKPVNKAQLKTALCESIKSTPRPRILHIEDDADIVHLVRELVAEKADISSTSSILGARNALNSGVFDMFILDLTLEDGNGVQLLEELQGRGPVMVFSAAAPTHEIAQNVAAYLTKSATDNNQLINTVQRILSARHTIAA